MSKQDKLKAIKYIQTHQQFEKELKEALDRQKDHFASVLADLKEKIEFVKNQIDVGYPRNKIIKYIEEKILNKF